MVAYNFSARFAEAVKRGEKMQTVRLDRKHGHGHARPGFSVQLYTGMRTKACRKLVDPDPFCIGGAWVEITKSGDLYVSGILHPDFHRENFAKRDGFTSWAEMREWFAKTHGLPFIGRVIYWRWRPR